MLNNKYNTIANTSQFVLITPVRRYLIKTGYCESKINLKKKQVGLGENIL